MSENFSLKAVWRDLSLPIIYDSFINKIFILTNFPKKKSMQKNVTYYCLLRKIF